MPRKQKVQKVVNEYGVKGSGFSKGNDTFVENQIVQLDIDMDEQRQKDLMEYNPTMNEPKGIEPEGISEFETIQQSVDKKDNEKNMKTKFDKYVNEKNETIQKTLEARNEVYKSVESDDILQWVDLDGSKAFMANYTNWPNVDLPCFWCLEKFNGPSWPLTVGRNKDGKFKVRGVHCSPECALAHGMDSREISENISLSSMYSWMESFVYKVTGNYKGITPAPPRMMMQKFGGPMTIDMFKLASKMEGYNSYLTYPPLESSLVVWNRLKTNIDKDLYDDSETKEEDQLVLKRKTPFYNKDASLESVWKLKTIKQ